MLLQHDPGLEVSALCNSGTEIVNVAWIFWDCWKFILGAVGSSFVRLLEVHRIIDFEKLCPLIDRF